MRGFTEPDRTVALATGFSLVKETAQKMKSGWNKIYPVYRQEEETDLI